MSDFFWMIVRQVDVGPLTIVGAYSGCAAPLPCWRCLTLLAVSSGPCVYWQCGGACLSARRLACTNVTRFPSGTLLLHNKDPALASTGPCALAPTGTLFLHNKDPAPAHLRGALLVHNHRDPVLAQRGSCSSTTEGPPLLQSHPHQTLETWLLLLRSDSALPRYPPLPTHCPQLLHLELVHTASCSPTTTLCGLIVGQPASRPLRSALHLRTQHSCQKPHASRYG